MTINEARKVARLLRIASRIPDPVGSHAWTLEGMRAAVAEQFPDFDWELRNGELIPFDPGATDPRPLIVTPLDDRNRATPASRPQF